MKRLCHALPLAALALAVAGPAAASAAVAGNDGDRKVVIKRFVVEECEGEECEQEPSVRRVVVVGDHGDAHRLHHRDGHHDPVLRGGKAAFLGVRTTELTPELRRHFGVPEETGVLVARVADDSAAARAGIAVGDILAAVDGRPLSSSGDLIREIGRHEPGAAVDLELWRDGVVETVGATLGERRAARPHVMLHHCSEGDEDCPRIAALDELDCGDGEECEVRIECRDGGCECTVNRESADCETIPGFVAPGE